MVSFDVGMSRARCLLTGYCWLVFMMNRILTQARLLTQPLLLPPQLRKCRDDCTPTRLTAALQLKARTGALLSTSTAAMPIV